MIYLISDGHKENINLKYYFTTEAQIKKFIESFYDNFLNKSVKNINVDLENLNVEFISICKTGWGVLNNEKLHLYELKKYEKS